MTPEELHHYLQKLGVQYETYAHEPVLTVDELLATSHQLPAFAHCKNLFLKDRRKRFWLLSALTEANIRLKELGKEIDAPGLRFANNEELMECLGVIPGSVTIFGLINDQERKVNVLLDSEMLKRERVGFHPLTNSATTVVASKDLLRFVDSCGNRMRVVDF